MANEYIFNRLPNLKYVEGNKKFGELESGDFIYVFDSVSHRMSKRVVREPIRELRGSLILLMGGNTHVEFGPVNLGGVQAAREMSVFFDGPSLIVGTDAETILDIQLKIYRDKMSVLEKCIEDTEEIKRGFYKSE